MQRSYRVLKLIFTCGLCLILVGLVILRREDIISIINTRLARNNPVSISEINYYYRKYDFKYVQNVNDIFPSNYQDLLNIFYSVLNSGQITYTFYCPPKYTDCLTDIQKIANDEDALASINNYVHPFNSFSHIETKYDTLGKVTINIVKNYSTNQIELINKKIDELYPKLVDPNDNLEDNIKRIHDYIINTTKYDSDKVDKEIINYKSDIAYGPLFEGYAVCGGYSDLMELFLERMNVESFKVSSERHIWNAVKMGNRWYHLDLTWDDPVSSDGRDYLEYQFFLLTTEQLWKIEKTQHGFIPDLYPELKETNQ